MISSPPPFSQTLHHNPNSRTPPHHAPYRPIVPAVVGSADEAAAAGAAPAASAPAARPPVGETLADKHKRVEAKRREEEERRRAELEAKSRAKDDKMRVLEAAKQQQRQGGAGGGGGGPTLRPPAPPSINPLAVVPAGKRPPLNLGAWGRGNQLAWLGHSQVGASQRVSRADCACRTCTRCPPRNTAG